MGWFKGIVRLLGIYLFDVSYVLYMGAWLYQKLVIAFQMMLLILCCLCKLMFIHSKLSVLHCIFPQVP